MNNKEHNKKTKIKYNTDCTVFLEVITSNPATNIKIYKIKNIFLFYFIYFINEINKNKNNIIIFIFINFKENCI
jgi:hypothetical protein